MDSHFSQRISVLAITSWLSVCLIIAGFLPERAEGFTNLWAVSGLVGLISTFGLLHLVRRESEGQKKMIDSMKQDAETDSLTQIANRRTFDAYFQQRLEESAVDGQPVLVALVDIDLFKDINDEHGHSTGDLILKFVSESAISILGGSGLVARIGGDEFAFISKKPANDRMLTNISMFASKVQYQSKISQGLVPVTLSIGVSISQRGDTLVDTFNRADSALYQIKSDGRNGIGINNGTEFKSIKEFLFASQDT